MEKHVAANPHDDRRKRILECAFDVVLRYGYQRMTMDDVAKACGMSRPALYLQFKNKGEIYSAIASEMMRRALEGAKAALDGKGSIEDRLFAAIKSGILDPMEFLYATAHGAELLDMKHQMAGDVIADWRSKKSAMIAAALDTSRDAKPKSFTGAQLAQILLDGMDGLKMRAKSAQERSDGAKMLVKLVCG
ncbi:MAG: TetR/AcrR family transcriptional regulator [Rhizobiaceae bacterium]